MEKNKEEIIKMIENECKQKDILEIISKIVGLSICSVIAKIIIDRIDEEIFTPSILSIFIPWGYVVIHMMHKVVSDGIMGLFKLVCVITLGAFFVLWIFLELYISAYIGIIAMPVILIKSYIDIKKILNADYSSSASFLYWKRGYENDSKINNQPKKLIDIKQNETKRDPPSHFPEYEYYCDRCDKRISEKQYTENAGLCEDCDAEVYFGERYDYDDYDMYR